MLTKIVKYLKSFICCILIICTAFASYAANSASDPSAFVTKEEFDKALSDFNTRLTVFEAGINSKIDSQVTSYLDRNGIWNGKEQVINTTGQTFYVQSIDPTANSSGVTNLANYTLVDNIDKSGLVVIEGEYYNQGLGGVGYNWGFWFEKNGTTTNNMVAGTALMASYYNGKPGSDEVFFSKSIGSGVGSGRCNGNWASGYAMISIGSGRVRFNDIFFVDKDDVVKIKVDQSWWLLTGCSMKGSYGNQLTFAFDKIKIY